MTTHDSLTPLTAEEILDLMPYGPPMQFVDRIDELDDEHIVATHLWTEKDCEGHFRDNLVVPGVKLIEFGAQTGIVAWGFYQASLELSRPELDGLVALFTHLEEVRFHRMVRPGQTTVCEAWFGDEGFFRDLRMRADVSIHLADGPGAGKRVFSGVFAGTGVPGARLETLSP